MLNTITINGRICNELELKTTANGTEVLNFTIACERDYKDQNGEKAVDFIDCIAFKHIAAFVSKYFAKGRMAIVNGKLQTRTWEDKNGSKRKSVEIVAENVYFADSKTNEGANKNANRGNSAGITDVFVPVAEDEELPF
jgi:single-strand DNA-binding protein